MICHMTFLAWYAYRTFSVLHTLSIHTALCSYLVLYSNQTICLILTDKLCYYFRFSVTADFEFYCAGIIGAKSSVSVALVTNFREATLLVNPVSLVIVVSYYFCCSFGTYHVSS